MSGSIPLITGSAGVYIREEDLSQQDIPITTGIGAIVFASHQGSLTPQLMTSATNFTNKYGKSDLSLGFGQIEALAFLAGGINPNNPNPTALWCLRAVNDDAKYAGVSVMNTLNGVLGDVDGEGIGFINPFPVGTTNNYLSGGREIFLLSFTEALATGASLSGTITYASTPVAFGPIVYATSPAATMAAIVTALNAALTTVPAGTTNESQGISQILLGDPTQNGILIYGPEGNTITVAATLTGQVGNTATVAEVNDLFDVWAENPGAWADGIGINITNINTGILQRTQLTFSNVLVTSNVINLSLLVNSALVVIPAQTWATNNDATLTALAAAIQTAIPNSVVAAVIPTGSDGTYARQINITAPNAGPGVISLYSDSVTGGASQPTITFIETYAGVASNNTFTLNVWQRGNISTPLNSYNCSLQNQLDGFGNQLYISTVINPPPASANSAPSAAIAVINVAVNTAAIAAGAGVDPAFANNFATIVWLNGGVDGSLPTDSQIIAAWNTFNDTESYRINLIINNGYTDVPVMQSLAQLAVNRMDCMAILDIPSNVQDVQDAINFRNTQMDIDTSYAAVYSSDVQILDTDNDQNVLVPPSGFVAARYVYTDNKYAVFWAPAGTDRGLLPNVTGLRQIYLKPDRDLLHAAQINPLKQATNGSGIVIWGDDTLQVAPSLLSAVNVRRLMTFIEQTIATSSESSLFNQNTAQLAFNITQQINSFLQPMVGSGISNFLVLANATNNPGYFGDAGQFNISVYIVPIRAIRTILLDAIVTPSTISISQLIIAGVF